ncbi:unnamed protein product, partial [Timema podura]|nr:unnamed protein product [Timema podura]
MGADGCPLHFGEVALRVSRSPLMSYDRMKPRVGTTTVHLGSQNLNSVESGKVTVTTRSHVNHVGYNTDNLNNDIALLRLPFSVTLGCEYT